MKPAIYSRFHVKQLFLFAAFVLSGPVVFSQGDSFPSHIYTYAEQGAEYPGGTQELLKFIQKNIVLPQLSHNETLPSRPVAKLMISEDGSVSGAEITKSSGNKELDKALLDVLHKMPKWKPARQNGHPVKYFFLLPINCILYK